MPRRTREANCRHSLRHRQCINLGVTCSSAAATILSNTLPASPLAHVWLCCLGCTSTAQSKPSPWRSATALASTTPRESCGGRCLPSKERNGAGVLVHCKLVTTLTAITENIARALQLVSPWNPSHRT